MHSTRSRSAGRASNNLGNSQHREQNPVGTAPTQTAHAPVSNMLQPTGIFTLRIPKFWKENPAIWFAQIEAQFELRRITSEQEKYFIVLPELEPELLSQVSDIILSRPPDVYTKIKERLIDHFSISEEKRIKQLLNELEIGDRKPSGLLREMRGLARNGVSEDFLRTMWLQRLPAQTQAILAASSENIDTLAVMADKITDISARPSISGVAAMQTFPDMAEIKQQIAALSSAINDLKGQHTNRSRSRSRTPAKKPNDVGYCYFHRRFGANARKCRKPCSFKDSSSENPRSGH